MEAKSVESNRPCADDVRLLARRGLPELPRRLAGGSCGSLHPKRQIGAGEGNRTLAMSLEGSRASEQFQAHSDKTRPFGTIDAQQLFAVISDPDQHRITAALEALVGGMSDPTYNRLAG